MTTIATITNIELGRAVVGFASAPDTAAVDNWRVVPTTAGAVSSDVYHVALVGTAATVYFSPKLSPSATYTLSTATTTGGVTTSSSQAFTAPASAKPAAAEWSHGLLRAWSRAISQAVQQFSGVVATISTQDIQPSETSIYVESTLGFPTSGYLYVGDARYRYTSRGDAAFHGVTRDDPTTATERRRQLVYLDTSSVWPAGGVPQLVTVGRRYTDPNGVL